MQHPYLAKNVNERKYSRLSYIFLVDA